MPIEKSHDEFFTSKKPCISMYRSPLHLVWTLYLKHDVRVNLVDSNCVEMGVDVVEMTKKTASFKISTEVVITKMSRYELYFLGNKR